MLKKYKDRNFEFNYKINKSKEVLSPILEIYRGKMYLIIVNNFIHNCINIFDKEIFSFKKSFNRTLTNLLSSWLFDLYSKYDFKNDVFFPSNFKNTEVIKNVLKDYTNNKFESNETETKIKIITDKLIVNYELCLNNLNSYKKSNYFFNNYKNFIISKKLMNDKSYPYYKFSIKLNFTIKDIKLENILNNIIIPEDVYIRCKKKYCGLLKYFDTNIWIIIFRYQLLGSNNHQLAVLPSILEKMNKDFNLDFECFASSINSISNNYCSIYYDIERFFGSKGSFFNFTPISGTYSFNPPYQSELITNGIYKLFKYLDYSYANKKILNFIITIPIWDIEGKKQMEDNNNSKINYGEFEIINSIKKNRHFKGLRMVSKNYFTYLDHNFKLYKDVTIQNTYVIVLSTDKNNNFIEKINKYNFKKQENVIENNSENVIEI
jgi:hypothetical protein